MTNLPRDSMAFLPLGGTGEIGLNLSLYHYRGKWLMVDLGIAFADETMPGIDLLVPDPSFIVDRADDLVGLVLTHAHEDHLGAVPWLWPDLECPVYASPFAAAMLKTKLVEAGLEDDLTVNLFRPGETVQLGPFAVTPLGITHSIPEAHSLVIETDAARVVHSGDWKLDPDPLVGPATEAAAFLAAGGRGVDVFVCDSTNVFREGSSGSEAAVRDGLSGQLAHCTGRVAITTFASNVARLESIAVAAAEHDRRVCLVGRSLWRVTAAAKATGYLKGLPEFLSERDGGYLPKNKVLYLCTGCQGEPRGAMARIASGDHQHVALGPGDTAIFSSRIIPGNERQLGRLHNQLALSGVEVITERDAFVHVSGHPARGELAALYGWLKPRMAIPVHGEARHLFEHADLARQLGVPAVVVPGNGRIIRLDPDDPGVVDEVPHGRLAVENGVLLRPQGAVLQGRRRLMHNGALFATLVVDPRGRMVEPPRIACHGVGEADDGLEADLLEDLEDALTEDLRRLTARAAGDDDLLAEAARAALRRLIKQRCGRRPVVDVHVVRLEFRPTKEAAE